MPKHSVTAFLARKDIEVSFQRYAIDALSAMAQGLFASLLIGTILTTVGDLSGVGFFNRSARSPRAWQGRPWPLP